MSPEAAALNAAQTLSLSDHVIWSRLRARKLNTWIGLIVEDKKLRDDK
jgi:phosphoribosylaminoimidazole carboxylase/phosphoribosylaminoimidazole-succinocarboxamide synthase